MVTQRLVAGPLASQESGPGIVPSTNEELLPVLWVTQPVSGFAGTEQSPRKQGKEAREIHTFSLSL